MSIKTCYGLFSYDFFFFFQAEDGIRDHCVTGVQTCALPISSRRRHTNHCVTGVQTCALPISKWLPAQKPPDGHTSPAQRAIDAALVTHWLVSRGTCEFIN